MGLVTETSGKLKISINCLHQSQQYISPEILKSLKYGNLMQRIGYVFIF